MTAQRRKGRVALWQGALLAFMAGIALLWLPHLLAAPFHEDEAIYAAWSLAILRGDPWLWYTPVDKPPLTFYPIALSLALFGQQVWAARLPNLLWTLLLLVILWRGGITGWLALFFALLSPLLWAMAASAFTDPAMVALAFLAMARAVRGYPAQAGLAFALALLAKPTALFLLPLALFPLRSRGASALPRFLLACAAPLLLAWAWDASRVASSWWVLGGQAYGTLGHASGTWAAWATLVAASLGWQLLIGGLAATLSPCGGEGQLRDTCLLALMLLGWVPLHILLGMQPWERYLLPLVPIAALLWAKLFPLRALGVPPPSREPLRQPLHLQRPATEPLADEPRSGARLRVRYPPRRLYLFGGLMGAFLLLIPAFVEQYQLEPHDGRWEGIAQIGAAIESLPAGATVFYQETGRLLAWYAADARARLVWGGASEAALQETMRQYGLPHYLVLSPSAEDKLPANWQVVREAGRFVLLKEE